jgi:hypothetical protein
MNCPENDCWRQDPRFQGDNFAATAVSTLSAKLPQSTTRYAQVALFWRMHCRKGNVHYCANRFQAAVTMRIAQRRLISCSTQTIWQFELAAPRGGTAGPRYERGMKMVRLLNREPAEQPSPATSPIRVRPCGRPPSTSPAIQGPTPIPLVMHQVAPWSAAHASHWLPMTLRFNLLRLDPTSARENQIAKIKLSGRGPPEYGNSRRKTPHHRCQSRSNTPEGV